MRKDRETSRGRPLHHHRRPLPLLLVVAAVCACEATPPDRRSYPLDTRADEPFASASEPAAAADATPRRVAARQPPPPTEPVTRLTLGDARHYAFEFRDTPVADALRLIADRAAVNFVVPPDLKGQVTASLPGVTLDQAFDVVLSQIHMRLTLQQDVYSIEPVPTPGLIQRIYQPLSADLVAIEPQLKAILGEDQLTVNAQANVAYVLSTAEKLAQIDHLMEVIDQSPREVLIEARIVEVSLDDGYQFGISAALADLGLGSVDLGATSDLLPTADDFTVTALSASADLSAVLNTIQTFGRLHVIASPRVLAINQEKAIIEIISKIPYIQSTNTTNGNDAGVSTTSVQQVEFEETGIKLHVTPVLGEGDEVTLKVEQDVAELVEFFNGVPVTDNRKVNTRFVVRDRETIVIGGLLKERRHEIEEGIPWLMELPLVGPLFSRIENETEKIELLVFITPRIVSQGEVMGVSAEYRRELMNKSVEYHQGYQENLDDIDR